MSQELNNLLDNNLSTINSVDSVNPVKNENLEIFYNDITTFKNFLKYIYQQKKNFCITYGAQKFQNVQNVQNVPSSNHISYPIDLGVCRILIKYENFLKLFYKILEYSQNTHHFDTKNYTDLWTLENLKYCINLLEKYIENPFLLPSKLTSATQKMVDSIEMLVPIRNNKN
jgi:hypothetical protein